MGGRCDTALRGILVSVNGAYVFHTIPLKIHLFNNDVVSFLTTGPRPLFRVLHHLFQYCVHPFCTRLYDSLTLIDGQMRMKKELLDQSTERRVRGRDKGQPTQHNYNCNLLVKLVSKN